MNPSQLRVVAARIRPLVLAMLVWWCAITPAAATVIIFDNFPGTGGITGGGGFQLGDEIDVPQSAPRFVTELDFGFTNGNTGSPTANVQAFLYANDGAGGSPGTLLWESAVVDAVIINSNHTVVAFSVPSILVPTTFTATASITDQVGNFGYAAATGANIGTFVSAWIGSPGAWIAIPPAFEIETRVLAMPVSEPSTPVLALLALVVCISINRKRTLI